MASGPFKFFQHSAVSFKSSATPELRFVCSKILAMDHEVSQRIDWLADVLMVVWFVLLVPWLPVAFLIGFIADGGTNAGVYIMIWSTWLYPVAVVFAAKFREAIPWLVLLPLSNLAIFILGAALGDVKVF